MTNNWVKLDEGDSQVTSFPIFDSCLWSSQKQMGHFVETQMMTEKTAAER